MSVWPPGGYISEPGFVKWKSPDPRRFGIGLASSVEEVALVGFRGGMVVLIWPLGEGPALAWPLGGSISGFVKWKSPDARRFCIGLASSVGELALDRFRVRALAGFRGGMVMLV